MRYLKEKTPYFIKITQDNKEINKEIKIISNSEKKIKIKRVLYKEKRNVEVLLYVTTIYLFFYLCLCLNC